MLLPLYNAFSSLGRGRASAVIPFDPSQLTNWRWAFDPASAVFTDRGRVTATTTDNTLIGSGTDPTGNLHHPWAFTDAYKPTWRDAANGINGHPAVQYAAGKFFLCNQAQFSAPTDIFGAGYNTALSLGEVLSSPGHGSLKLSFSCSGNPNGFYAGWDSSNLRYNFSGLTITGAVSATQIAIPISTSARTLCQLVTYNGSQIIINVNGTEYTYAATGNLGLSGGIHQGSYGGGSGFDWPGKISRQDLCEYALPLADRRSLMAWMLDYAGLTPLPQIIFDGDSLTSGQGVTAGNTYPDQTIALLGGTSIYDYSNFGVGGQTAAQMGADAATQVDVLWSYYRPRNIYCAWAGTNTIYLGGSGSGATAYTDLKSCAAGRTTAGFSSSVSTMLPRTASGGYSGTETERQTLNSALRADFTVATGNPYVWLPAPGVTYAACLIDVAAITAIGAPGAYTNLTYYQSDETHCTAAAYALVADPYHYAISNGYL